MIHEANFRKGCIHFGTSDEVIQLLSVKGRASGGFLHSLKLWSALMLIILSHVFKNYFLQNLLQKLKSSDFFIIKK